MCARREQIIIYTQRILLHRLFVILRCSCLKPPHTHAHTYTRAYSNQQLDDCVRVCVYIHEITKCTRLAATTVELLIRCNNYNTVIKAVVCGVAFLYLPKQIFPSKKDKKKKKTNKKTVNHTPAQASVTIIFARYPDHPPIVSSAG